MPKISPTLQNTKTKDANCQKNWIALRRLYEQLARIINGLISFGDGTNTDNMNGSWQNFTTPLTPNTDFTLIHNLGRQAVGYIVVAKSATCDVFTSATSNPNPGTQIILQATGASVVMRLFII